MSPKITVVINTLNEEKNIQKTIESVSWADEVLVCDMYSSDKTVEIAKKVGAKVVLHKQVGFVEPARNFAISKASNEWILVLDADEVVEDTSVEKLRQISEDKNVDFVQMPRKNIIFGKWMQASMWWPDYNVRFFKKGKVKWGNKIHRPPLTEGNGLKLPDKEEYAIVHYNYSNLSDYLVRLNNYTTIQADELISEGYYFEWKDLFIKPVGEFLSRFFASRGFEDGLHGLALSFLQAFSFLVVYLKVWEKEGFKRQDINLDQVEVEIKSTEKQFDYWFTHTNPSKNPLKQLLKKAKYRLS